MYEPRKYSLEPIKMYHNECLNWFGGRIVKTVGWFYKFIPDGANI